MSLESQLQQRLLLAAPKLFPSLRLFRRNVGAARMYGSERVVHFAIKGQCDLYGILRGGKLIEVELKGPDKKLKPEQRSWEAWCKEWGVPHIVLTAMKDETEDETITRWCGEIYLLILRAENSSSATPTATTPPSSLPPPRSR